MGRLFEPTLRERLMAIETKLDVIIANQEKVWGVLATKTGSAEFAELKSMVAGKANAADVSPLGVRLSEVERWKWGVAGALAAIEFALRFAPDVWKAAH